MTGFSFTLPGLEQISDPRQLRGCLLRLTEQLQYVRSKRQGSWPSRPGKLPGMNFGRCMRRSSAQRTN